MMSMDIKYTKGVMVGPIRIDPESRCSTTSIWTHRAIKHPRSTCTMYGSIACARQWPDIVGFGCDQPIDLDDGLVVTLLPSGYGVGGVAVLLESDQKVLVVGPTSEKLATVRADVLVLRASTPADRTLKWLSKAIEGHREGYAIGYPFRVHVPDAAAMEEVSANINKVYMSAKTPSWFDDSPCKSYLTLVTGRSHFDLQVDMRPQADIAWLADYAQAVAPRTTLVHGPAADKLMAELRSRGVPAERIDQ